MFVDISKSDQGTATNWVAESGVLDLFFLLGPTPHQVAIPVAHVTADYACQLHRMNPSKLSYLLLTLTSMILCDMHWSTEVSAAFVDVSPQQSLAAGSAEPAT